MSTLIWWSQTPSLVDMLRMKMGTMPRGKSDSAAMREDTQEYGHEMRGNMLEWEVVTIPNPASRPLPESRIIQSPLLTRPRREACLCRGQEPGQTP